MSVWDKQIKKKPKKTGKFTYSCPTCGNTLILKKNYCKCGQALDWSKIE